MLRPAKNKKITHQTAVTETEKLQRIMLARLQFNIKAQNILIAEEFQSKNSETIQS
jgi:hypothetical protein